MKSRLSAHTANPHSLTVSISACIATLISVALLPSMAQAQSGDMNCDGAFNIADIPVFVEALLNPGDFGGCDINRANMNADTLIDGRDTQPFVAALMAPMCPVGLTNCGGTCVNLAYDSQNCGACFNVCAVGETCSGSCIPTEPCPGCGPP